MFVFLILLVNIPNIIYPFYMRRQTWLDIDFEILVLANLICYKQIYNSWEFRDSSYIYGTRSRSQRLIYILMVYERSVTTKFDSSIMILCDFSKLSIWFWKILRFRFDDSNNSLGKDISFHWMGSETTVLDLVRSICNKRVSPLLL